MTWYDEDYGYKKKITIDHTKVGSDELDFPVLISVTDADLADTSNGGQVEHSSGYDIIFTNSAENAQLDHEIEKYVNTSGLLIFWVSIASLSSSGDTDFYIYYGKSGVGADPSTTDTWDSNFKGVYHLNETVSTTITDSTSGGNDGDYIGGTLPTPVAAKIGTGQDMVGTSGHYLDMPSGVHTPEEGTVEMWVSQEDVAPTGIYYNRDVAGSISDYIVLYYTSVRYEFYNDGDWNIGGDDVSGTQRYFSFGWEDGAQNFRINASNIGTATYSAPPNYAFRDIRIGSAHVSSLELNGVLDEIRLSNTKRTDAWRNTTYETQNDPGNFMSWGDEEEPEEVNLYETPSDTFDMNDSVVFKHEIPIDDTLDMSDALIVTRLLALDDTLDISDTPIFKHELPIDDTLDITDDLILTRLLAVDDTLDISDALILTRLLALGDTLSISDTPIFKHELYLSDALSIIDSLGGKSEINLNDTLDIDDSIVFKHLLTLDDALSIDDALVLTHLLLLNDTLDISDTPIFRHELNIDELIDITDSIIQTRKITFDDDFDVTDTPIFKHLISISDDMEIYTLFAHGSENFHSFEDWFSIYDATVMKHGFPIDDSVDINDSILFTHKLIPVEYFSITDTLALYLYNVDLANIAFPDDFDITDTVTFKRLLTLDDDLDITDEPIFKHILIYDDTISISDSIVFSHSIPIVDSVNIDDNVLYILFAGQLFINLSETLGIADSVLFKHGLLPTDSLTMSDDAIFKFLLSFADSVSFEDFIFNSLIFKLDSDSYSIQLPMPIYAGEAGSLSNDLVLFNFWSDDRDVNTIGISDEPITLTGTIYAHIDDKETGMSTIATKFLNIHALMDGHEEVIITGLGNSVDATYIIKNFRYGTIRGAPYAYTWQLTLEYVRV